MIEYQGKEIHTYVIPGQPIAWARPRLNGRTFFDCQKPIKANWAVSLEYQRELQPFYSKVPLEFIVNFYFSIPLSYKPERRAKYRLQPFTFKPDIDNAVKFVLDCCSAILFDDDCSIFKIVATKQYDMDPRTEFAFIPHTTQVPFKPTPKKNYLYEEEDWNETRR